ncbi:hypothetical protein GCM10022254_76970 [Actinomadura meridiana]|uniref:N-acetyltransferase domain-containing protein n=1 Tax=Actinomadura meridiana TaxID=559626 RepID=A0ABP8CSA4_9ACTN
MARHPDWNLDELVAAAWPAPSVQSMDGWLFRHAAGVTKRANSVLPLNDPGDVGPAVDQAERFYTSHGLPTVFSLGARPRPANLDMFLDGRGYELVDPTLAMVKPLTGAYERDGVEIAASPSQKWLDLWWTVDGRYDHQMPMAERILTGVPAGYAFLDGVAVGRAVPQGPWLGIYAMAVVPDARRRGLGRRVLRALLGWGREQGCDHAYLVVVEGNAAAVAMYESEGFTRAGGYHYRVRDVAAK